MISNTHCQTISAELSISSPRVAAVAALLAEGATLPFIARYRKERTGSLDEVSLGRIRDRLDQLEELDKRRKAILRSLAERELLTDELRSAVLAAETLSVLEDLYLPHRPKRRTRAKIAKERGLEPLADLLLTQNPTTAPEADAARFVDRAKEVPTVEDALAGARDILAERVSEDAESRAAMRCRFAAHALLAATVIKGTEEVGAKFSDYFDRSEPAAKVASHRVLAILRGEREGVLRLSLRPPEAGALAELQGRFLEGPSAASDQVALAIRDGYERLLAPSMETELRRSLAERADEEAIRVFSQNLVGLLMAPPLGEKRVLAIDPGYRTGGKVVCLDPQGRLLEHTVVHPTGSEAQRTQAATTLRQLVTRHDIEAVAIGNGTASRETEAFVRGLDLPAALPIVLVSESGASIYSASAVAREEFPDLDLTVRGAISIGRRLMDPLAELVKIDPKSLGVGQYQHDVDQASLKAALDEVVSHCVNRVGVEVNTASVQILTHISGLGPALAKAIVSFRDANGPFRNRQDLLKVPRLGPKAFEQAAGFLRIRNGEDPLDNSAVHPESYPVVARMATDVGATIRDLIEDSDLRAGIDPARYVTESVGLPTLTDILAELEKPGRDPRERFEPFAFAEDVHTLDDLQPGMKLPGIVTNVTAFGAFVDIGVHQDGLIHVSQLADRYVKDPNEVVRVHQRLVVTVLEVDKDRKRIGLSLRRDPSLGEARRGGGGCRKAGEREWSTYPTLPR